MVTVRSEMAEVPKTKIKEKCCQSCGQSNRFMKRCIQCHQAIYCSRECQLKDWPAHKTLCLKPLLSNDSKTEECKKKHLRDSKSIFDDDIEENIANPEKQEEIKVAKVGEESEEKPYYLHNNDFHYDIPKFSPQSDCFDINVKANKEKYVIKLQNCWSGDEIFKMLAHTINIPLEKLKIIHKGKVMTKDNIAEFVKAKAVFQVIGEQAANEDGLDKCDISVMMKQLGIDRNTAVNSLRKNGNLVDAIIEVGNK